MQELAVKHKFYQRKAELTPYMFFEMLMYIASQTEACSLEQNSTMLKSYYKLQIRKQSIDDRFNDTSVAFVKEILKRVLEKQLTQLFIPNFLTQFNKIRIKDSTRFILPDRLSAHYKGSGGSKGTSKAGVSIQFEYDAKSGKVLSLEVTNGSRNDHTDAKETINNIDARDLVIRDLGYYSLPNLISINKSNAYFVSRLGAKTTVYENNQEISFKELYNKMKKNNQPCLELNVKAGKTEQMPVRLIVSIVPDEIYEKRIRKIEKENQAMGYKTSDDYKSRCRLNLFITNTDQEIITNENVITLYKLRWQIELMFKNLKSICKIDEIQPMKYARFTCVLFAKLILVVINLQLIWGFKKYYYVKKRKILSLVKCFKTLQQNVNTITKILRKKEKESRMKIKKLAKIFSENHWKEKKNKTMNYEDILDIFICNTVN